jgi:creatinine amidohydrolase
MISIAIRFFAAFGGQLELPWPREADGHAGPGETSMMLALRPDLVNMDLVPEDDEGKARNRLHALRDAGVQTGIWWYADHPTHYAGNAAYATADAGNAMLDVMAAAVARAVRAIKADTAAQQLQDEFFARSSAPSV